MYVVLDVTVSVDARGFTPSSAPGTPSARSRLVPESGRVARVRAATPVCCLSVPRDDFIKLVESEPPFALTMPRELARRLSNYSVDG